MDHNEVLKCGQDPDGLSKRRISSILKASRTSIKAFSADQDELQDETKTIEKRRNSRRVSFATTNDVHVFSKDIKTESPVLSAVQNLSDETSNGPNKRVLLFPTSENQQVKDLNTIQQHKENFFPDLIVQDDFVNQTLLLGEDSEYMDMTHSHTITIANGDGNNPDLTFSILGNSTGHHTFKTKSGKYCKSSDTGGKDAVHSEFSDFLASISKPQSTQNPTPSSPPKVNPHFEDLKPRCSISAFQPAQMDMTRNHTVEIYSGQSYSACENVKNTSSLTSLLNNSADMDLTSSQTATINLKEADHVNHMSTAVDQNAFSLGSGDGSAVMTHHKVVKDNAVSLCPQANVISLKNLCQNSETCVQDRADHFQKNSYLGPILSSDDMEITQSQTVVLETKRGEESQHLKDGDFCFAPSLDCVKKIPMLTSAVASESSMRNVTPSTETIFPSDQSDSMDLTCQANMSAIVSPCLDDMELTGYNNVTLDPEGEVTLKKHAPVVMPSSGALPNRKVPHFLNDFSVSHMSDDMKNAKYQSVVLQPKNRGKNKSFVKSRKSFRNDFNSKDMELTCEVTENLVQKNVSSERVTKDCLFPDCTEAHEGNISAHDMDLTGCNTVAIDTKSMEIPHEFNGYFAPNKFSSERINSVGPSSFFNRQDIPQCMKTHQGSTSLLLASDDMELTGCRTVAIDRNTSELQSALNMTSNAYHVLFSHPTLNKQQTGMPEAANEKSGSVSPLQNAKDKFQTASKDEDTQIIQGSHKDSVTSLANNNSSLNLTEKDLKSPEKDCSMEITKAFDVPFKEQCSSDFKQKEMTKENVPTMSGATHQRSLKERKRVLPANHNFDKHEVISEDTADTKERSNSVKSRRRSLADLQARLRNIAQSINDQNKILTVNVTEPILYHTSFQDHAKEMSAFKNETNASHIETPAPLNFKKNPLTARLSLGAIKPKLPVHPKLASLSQTETKNTSDFQSLLETCHIQNNSHLIDMDELLPEDLSDTVLSCLNNKKEDQEIHLGNHATEDDAFKSSMNISHSDKVSCEASGAEHKRKESSVTSWDSSSTSYGVQNATSLMTESMHDFSGSNSTNMKCEAISESIHRNSQLDSQVDGTVNHIFDFNKKLEDGSVTVNEFLSHFGANFVIHKSRPSALPENRRATQTSTMEDLLRENHIYRPKQSVYETDCQKLTNMGERLKKQMSEQNRPLRSINKALLQDMCSLSEVQLQRFGAKLKEQKMHFRKKSKTLSHEMKKVLYSELLKTTQDAQQNLMAKITETTEMLKDIDGCLNDLESEAAAAGSVVMGGENFLISAEPALKAKQQELEVLHLEVAESEKQICGLEVHTLALLETKEKLQDETRELEYYIATLNSLNEWELSEKDDHGAVFTFLHDTLQLQVTFKKATAKKWACEDVEQDIGISFRFLLDSKNSQSCGVMVHKFLEEYIQSKSNWNQKYPKVQHIPLLLHDISVVLSRLRLLGEEILRLKKCGLRFGVLHITCVDKLVEITFSSIKAFVKFELSLAVTSDYPTVPLQIQKFQNHIGNTRVNQIEHIMDSITPAKGYLTKVISRIHNELLNSF